MYSCDHDNSIVVYDKGNCPMCELIDEVASLNARYDILERDGNQLIDQLREENSSLNDEVKQLNKDIYRMQLEVF